MTIAVERWAGMDRGTDEGSRHVVRVRLLGGVGATTADGKTIDIGPAKCQLLLASLALSAGAALPVSRLVELVWGDDPPRTAEKTLQSYVTRLRRGLGTDSIVRVGAAYRLDVDVNEVDALRFQRCLDADDIDGALAEWGGPPLAGLEPAGLGPTVAGLVERWLAAVESDLERAVERDPAAAIGPLTEFTTSHPFREGLWALLMTALYALGRQADALSAYRRAREHLVEELGVEPGPRLREVEASILAQDADLPATARPTPPPVEIPSGTVTFGFTDVEGASRLWAADHDRASEAIARQAEIVRSTAEVRDGHIFSVGGDSIGVAFHRAGEAADWAIELHGLIEAEPWPDDMAIALRVGLHTGEAEERTASYFGPAVNTASRIVTAGHGGQTLVSASTAALLDGRGLQDLGTVRLDGISSELRLHQLGAGAYPPLRVALGARGNLPRSPGALHGRDELLDAVAAALRSAPIVNLVGPGGIGKTRLALDAARLASGDVAGGAWLVELADVTSPTDVARAVADAVDVTELPGLALTTAIARSLESRRALLVLDNCEHVVEGAAEVAAAVAELGSTARVLATSREGLGIAGEQLVAVGPLDASGAGVRLFDERAAAVDRTYDGELHRDAVEEICRRLDGVPLAIELAAGRVRTFSPADLVERLDDSFRLLAGGRRRSVERHRTLRTTIQWSYDLLTAEEQMAFRRLSVFAGSFDLHAAEVVTADDDLTAEDVDDLLGDLVERSMVLVESGAEGRRFRLLEIMRQFGAERLAEHGTGERIAARHARYVADQVAQIADQLTSLEEVAAARRLAELWPNLRAAFDWAAETGDLELAVALVGPIAGQMFVRRRVAELADWSERILAMAEPDDDDTIELGLLWISLHHSMTHDRDAFARIDDRYGRRDGVLARLARVAALDDHRGTRSVFPAAGAELRRRGEMRLATMFELFSAGALLGQGHLDEAEGELAALAERFRASGPPSYLNWTLFMLAAAADFRGDHSRAEAFYDEVRAIVVPPGTNSPNEILEARAAFRSGDEATAFGVLRAYIDELLAVGNMSGAGLISLEFVNMMASTDRLSCAARLLGYLDGSGVLDVEGPGFRVLVAESAAKVDADPDAAEVRREISSRGVDDQWAMRTIRELLDGLIADGLDPASTATKAGADRGSASSRP